MSCNQSLRLLAHEKGPGQRRRALWLSAPPAALAGGGGVGALVQIETVGVHHLGPGGDEVADELFLVVVLGVDLGVGAQD